MKSTTVALGLLSGMASAQYHHPRHFHQYYARNETTAYPSTTITVGITQTQVITSCAPAVTDCPLRNNETEATVTEIIDLTTIVCPATEVESVSSSVIGDHSSGLITGHTTTIGTPAPTGYPTVEVPSVTQSTGVVEQTLTMTVGPESSKSVLITTIHSTTTVDVTVTVTKPKPTPTAPNASSDEGSDNGSGEGSGEGEGSNDTTTLTSTSTGTKTNTVTRPGVEAGECVPVTVTVTETQAPSTVYVTAGASNTDVGAEAQPKPSNYPTQPQPEEGDEGSDEGSNEGSSNYPTNAPPPPVSEDITATIVPVPYPTGSNGTYPTYPTGVPPARK